MPSGKPPLFFDDIRSLLRDALTAAAPSGYSVWSVNPAADQVVYDLEPSGPNASGPTETFLRTYSIDAATRAVTLGDAQKVVRLTTYETVAPAQFSVAPGVSNGKTVTRPGKLFETGVWEPAPNRPAGFSLNEEEAKAALGYTVPIEIEHVRSVLDGKLGTATFTAFNGKDLDGYLTLPQALNELVGPENALPVSVVWDTATKKPLRVGIVLNPQITDAQVAAAFSAAESKEPRKGATMDKPSWFERFFGRKATDADVAAFAAGGEIPTPTPAPVATDPRIAQLEAENQRLRAAAQGNQGTAIEAAASQFAADAKAADKITPAEEADYAAAFSQAVLDDAAGEAAFGADGKLKEGPRVARLRAMVEKKPALGLTGERLTGGEAQFGALRGTPPPAASAAIDVTATYAKFNGQEASK